MEILDLPSVLASNKTFRETITPNLTRLLFLDAKFLVVLLSGGIPVADALPREHQGIAKPQAEPISWTC
jgi:hypothetical protein